LPDSRQHHASRRSLRRSRLPRLVARSALHRPAAAPRL